MASMQPPRPHHLIVMVNGINGSVKDWRFAAGQIKSRFGDQVLVLCSCRNAATSTYDGVDVMGHRLAEEIKEVVNRSPGLKRISFIAHSLGGLIARYAIGQLYSPCETDHFSAIERSDRAYDGKIIHLQPTNFITLATPHLGSRGNWQVIFLPFGILQHC
ncbi:hypothetical protein KP509_1Z242900 [Ceratopteris richardii]|nr:hypothetical protein KP509_1Z242900 [Ceratopteris richardii]